MLLESLHFASMAYQPLIAAKPVAAIANPAYLDPGTGSLIIQIAIGAVAGGLVTAKVLWKHIGSSFARMFSRSSRLEHTQH